MSIKMNVKLNLITEVVTVVYILFCSVLSKENLISSSEINFLIVIWFLIWWLILFYNKRFTEIPERTDNTTVNILSKTNKICLRFLIFSVGVVSIFLISPHNKDIIIPHNKLGISLMAILFVLTTMRLLLFIYYDKKELYE